jgi:hypothetical protein
MRASLNLLALAFLLLDIVGLSNGFLVHPPKLGEKFNTVSLKQGSRLCMSVETEKEKNKEDEGVMELFDEERVMQEEQPQTAPFLSQGEISPDALSPELSDPKETRVIIYMILSLLPVLFLIPLMLGSRDLIPLDALPPVEL